MKNIVFLGGSVTEGAGATNINNSYVNIVSEFLKEKYEAINITNSGAGGTASQFGIFRIKRDVARHSPDIVFIEFAVNDRIYSSKKSSTYFEGLIRELLKLNCKLICIETPTGMADACASIHKKIACYYNVPVIDVQDKVWQQIECGKYCWNDISIDNLHPNDLGHKIYGQVIINSLRMMNLDNINQIFKEKPLMNYNLNNPYVETYEKCTFYGSWYEKSFLLNNKFDLAAVTDNIGDCLEFDFSGKALGIMCLLSKDSGRIECLLDNKYTFEVDLYTNSDGSFSNMVNIMDLNEGKHNLLIKVSDRKNQSSIGNKIVIGGFLVDED
ncbi:Lysophospholipase L1 [Clostridium cavendishii DSM 21758]|uniref:Lysophospholipase L1 n=1 Tax=Clostridium cavendishii DSM 21758 TaxID=1121302 RepID=A0A1M6AYP9_9CLOT|nr:SGNH/GDSL hydrolase family protein [Clostridium cavendishii]SHI41639.1 Lysophospholipase L1 [Clostridium cavendishii DSM 21758]